MTGWRRASVVPSALAVAPPLARSKPAATLALFALVVLLAIGFLGAPSAIAETTALCKSDESTCGTGNGTTSLHETSVGKAKLLSGVGTAECNVLFASTKVGSAGAPQELEGNFTYTNCTLSGSSCTATEENGPAEIKVLKEGHEKAKVTGEYLVHVKCSGFLDCSYTGAGLAGTFKGPLLATQENGEVTISEQSLSKEAGGFLCPKTAKLDITTTPLTAAYLSKGGGGGLSSTSTSLSTELSGGGKKGAEITVAEGSKVKDTATLSGENASKAGGTLTYKVYSDSKCKELASEAGKVTVKEGKVPDSEEKELEAGKEYFWLAEYAGDEMNKASTSTCSKEVETVKANTSLSTKLSGGGKEGEEITVAEGSKVKDQATLSGTKSAAAGGTITYRVYSDSKCEKLVANAGEGEVKEGKAPASNGVALSAGTYYWRALYYGEDLYEGSAGVCGAEVATVKSTSLSLTTSLSGEEQSGNRIEVQEESPVTDTATLSGEGVGTATGTVEYLVYSDEDCEELEVEAGEVTVEAGEVPDSEEVLLSTGTTYYWRAHYSGDLTHEAASSTCGDEIVAVAEDTALATMLTGIDKEGEEIEPAEEIFVTPGTSVNDTAELSGENAEKATGVVEYNVYSDKECTKPFTETDRVKIESEGVLPPSSPVVLPSGTYYWQASYPGDSFNKPSTSPCGKEVAKVALESLTTLLSGEEQAETEVEVQPEAPVTDSATLDIENVSTATGTVEYLVYSDEDCEELEVEAGEVTVKEGIVPDSEAVELPTGTYYWIATYSGDGTHPEVASACGDEIENVLPATTLTTTLSGGGKTGAEIEVEEDAAVSDSATLSGPNASEATGVVMYFVYADKECTELVAEAGEVNVEGSTVPSSEAVEDLNGGSYYWQAVYDGDDLNGHTKSTCGVEVEKVRVGALTGILSGGGKSGDEIEVEEEISVKDVATLHMENSSTATGTVEYNVYADDKCEELEAEAGTVEVETGGKVPPSSEVKLSAGTYYWQAVYSGDLEHAEASSICSVEVQQVVPPPAWIVSVGDSYISGEGGRWGGNVLFNHLGRVGTWPMDALGDPAYHDAGGAEQIPRCHRSLSAEIHIKISFANRVESRNFACSGAETQSRREGAFFKPGLDFVDAAPGAPLHPGNPQSALCPFIAVRCKGQATMLEEFARALWPQKIKMLVVSIGGNDFEFGKVVETCAEKYVTHVGVGVQCRNIPEIKAPFEEPRRGIVRAKIQTAIERVGQALLNVGYTRADTMILVQDYPSPLPSTLRFLLPTQRIASGRCPFTNDDAAWANNTALTTIDSSVRQAATAAMGFPGNPRFFIRFLELSAAFNGMRLCEAGTHLLGFGRDWFNTPVGRVEWINQVRLLEARAPFMLQEDLHPNFSGQLALRNCLRQLYNSLSVGNPVSADCVLAPGGNTIQVPGAGVATTRGFVDREPDMQSTVIQFP